MHATPLPLTRRGFGLIDVSLGLISGISILVASVIFFQQIANTREVSQVSQTTFNLSSQIRAYSRSMNRISELPGSVDGDMVDFDLSVFEIGTDISTRISATSPASGEDGFTIRVADLRPRTCSRVLLDQQSLGVNVLTSECVEEVHDADMRALIVTFRR